MSRIEKRAAENESAIAIWRDLADLRSASISTDAIAEKVRNLRQILLRMLQEKLANPGRPSVDETELEAALLDYEPALEQVHRHGDVLAQANDQIASLKKRAASSDATRLEAELRRLRNTQIRRDPEVAQLCDELLSARRDKASVDEDKKEAREQLESESTTLLQQYQADINALLERFGASFSITGTRPKFAGGKASSTYQLEINGQSLELGDSRTPRGTPSFRTALSAGDKSTLALAFFLARLRRDTKLHEKIVVFDDPFSSLDCFRLTFTEQEIARVAADAGQVLVLSHDPFFLKGIAEAAGQTPLKPLRVTRSGSTSVLVEWDIDHHCLAQSHKDYFLLQTFLSDGLSTGCELMTVARAIRPYIEGHLRYRYPDRFPGRMMLGAMLDMIRQATPSDELVQLRRRLQELEDLRNYSNKFMHPAAATTTESEVVAYVQRALKVVRS